MLYMTAVEEHVLLMVSQFSHIQAHLQAREQAHKEEVQAPHFFPFQPALVSFIALDNAARKIFGLFKFQFILC